MKRGGIMNIYLEQSGVIVRETVFEDLELFAHWENKEYIKEFMTIQDNKSYEDVVEEYYLRLEDKSCIDFTIVDSVNNCPIGRLYVSRIDSHNDSCDLTRIYVGEEAYLGKGYGKKAILILLEYLFEDMSMNRVTLDFFDGNFKAAGLYESIGFVHEGKMRECGKKNGWYYNLNLMSILRSDYLGL